MNELALSEDGYLLSKVFHSKCLKKEIDISKINFEKRITREEFLKEIKHPDYVRSFEESQAGRQPKIGSREESHYIHELYTYDRPKPNDIVCWYDDIGCLSGSAGYVLIRDGYVWNTKSIWRS